MLHCSWKWSLEPYLAGHNFWKKHCSPPFQLSTAARFPALVDVRQTHSNSEGAEWVPLVALLHILDHSCGTTCHKRRPPLLDRVSRLPESTMDHVWPLTRCYPGPLKKTYIAIRYPDESIFKIFPFPMLSFANKQCGFKERRQAA